MPKPYIELYSLSKNVELQNRVQFAVHRAANVVIREASHVPNTDKRKAWAREAIKGPSQEMVSILNRVLTTGAAFNNGAEVTDDQLQAIVDGLVNDFAGV